MLAAALLAATDALPATLAEKSAGSGVGLTLAAGTGRMLSPGVARMPVVGTAEDAVCASACSGTDMCRSGCHCCWEGCGYCESSDAACPCCLLMACSLLASVSDEVCPWNSCMAESSNALPKQSLHISQPARFLPSVTRDMQESYQQPTEHDEQGCTPLQANARRHGLWLCNGSQVSQRWWHPQMRPAILVCRQALHHASGQQHMFQVLMVL